MTFKALAFICIAAPICGFSQNIIYNPNPLREFGQPQLNPPPTANPNLVEGREFYSPQSMAIDKSANPPILYVADTRNSRILAWKNATAFTKGGFADFVIGQYDMVSTGVSGNAPPWLNSPGGLAVDPSGNLYVIDTGNNRILRFPTPATHTAPQTPDLVIGQASLTSGNQPNEGKPAPSEKTLATTTSSGVANTSALAFDAQGNLWFADVFNNRVLRYPVSALGAGAPNEPAADLVLGQTDFVSNAPVKNNNQLDKTAFTQPQALAFSQSGDLYVADLLGQANGLGRVLYFKGPFVPRMSTNALRILGLYLFPPGAQAALNATTMNPSGLATLGDNLYVADQSAHRIMRFDTPDKWSPECSPLSTSNSGCLQNGISPPAIQFTGQVDSLGSSPNQGLKEPAANTLAAPSQVAFQGSEMYVLDTGNHRLLVFPQSGASNPTATRLLGQLDFNFGAPNLIEGRELFIYFSPSLRGGGLAVDNSSTPAHLYIADTLNNRVLGFRDFRSLAAGSKADIVIGQLDLFRNTPNYATGRTTAPTDSSLYIPVAVAVDKNGDLYVADAGNGRVLRFPQPFNQVGLIKANLVLGKPGFFTNASDASFASPSTMALPTGLAFTNGGHLLVSDAGLNRVLLFRLPAGGDFTNTASNVLGQSNSLTTSGASGAPDGLNAPQGLAVDSSDRVYVADAGNNRVNVFSLTDFTSRFRAGVSVPLGVAVNTAGQIWVTDSNRVVHRYPFFEQWVNSGQEISNIQTASSPLAIALDPSDNPIVAETINRVSFYYMAATFQNGGSWVTRALSPGMLAYLSRLGPSFAPGGTLTVANSQPWPTTLADTQVMFNGQPAPVYYVTPDRVAFQVPNGAPATGSSDVQLVRASTGEILAGSTFAMHSADPAFFTMNGGGFGQIAALNASDNSVNSPTNPVARDGVISLYGTGIGHIDGAPADGMGAPGPLSAGGTPLVSFNPGGSASNADIQYWGLAPGLPGVWQMNLHIPNAVPPGAAVQVAFFWNDYPSNDGPNGKVITTIAVK
jgi:uncharacterized protein (TIGR03437 family)